MQILEIDWNQFLDQLPPFQRLPREARRFYVEKVRQSQPVRKAELGEHAEHAEALLASGFLLSGPTGRNAAVPLHYCAFCRVMRSLHRHRIFDSPSAGAFHGYLKEHFTGAEQSGFWRLTGDYYGEGGLYSRVSSAEWLSRFLKTKAEKWEQQYAYGVGQPNYFSDGVLRTTKELVRSLMSRPSPVPLMEVRGLCPEISSALMAESMMAGIRCLLFFPALRGDELEPVLGIWPRIRARLFRTAPKPPATVTPRQVFHAPFLMDDVASLVAAGAVEPFRVRREDLALFARVEKQFAASLGTLPGWVESEFKVTAEERIRQARSFATYYEFLKKTGGLGEDLRLEVTETGRRWLGCPAKERLKTFLDGLRGTSKKRSNAYGYVPDAASLFPYSFGFSYDEKQGDAVKASVLSCFAGCGVENFSALQEFLAYHGGRNNPLVTLQRTSPHLSVVIRGAYVSGPNEDELEDAWTSLLSDFLRLRLLPLGGAKVGLHGDGAVCFCLTEAGQYLIGARPDFDLEQVSARIVVQPNFDVVFLGAAPHAESEIARFAERRARHVGTLFRITKQSILAAAAAGLAADQVFETLRQCCGDDLPPNVQHEISEWFGQCRQISVRPAVLIHCPDAGTAASILAIAGAEATPITNTMLELHDHKPQPALLRKLRESGIFVRP